MPITGTTTTAQFNQLQIREVDFVERFERNWQSLREIMGVSRPIRKELGTKLAASKATITLATSPAEGEEVPLSQAAVTPVQFVDITLEKYRKAVTAEAVAKYGAAVAVEKTDDALITELQDTVMSKFYNALTGDSSALTGTYATFQMAVAMAIGKVVDKFKTLHRDFTTPVVFVNTLDFYGYLGAAPISLQTQNGIQYVKDFMGASTMIVTSDIPSKTVIAIPADNLVNYYIDPADGDFKELGLDYTTSGNETNLIGVHKEGNYGRVMGETHALMGMALFFEYADGVSIVTIDSSAGE